MKHKKPQPQDGKLDRSKKRRHNQKLPKFQNFYGFFIEFLSFFRVLAISNNF